MFVDRTTISPLLSFFEGDRRHRVRKKWERQSIAERSIKEDILNKQRLPSRVKSKTHCLSHFNLTGLALDFVLMIKSNLG